MMGKGKSSEKFIILIDHDGVQMEARVRGRARYLKEKAFLEELTGLHFPPGQHRPIPDPTTDFFMLNDEQLDAYSRFRKKLRREQNAT